MVPRSASFAVTLAPTIGAPLGSETVPVIVAVTSCPHAGFAVHSTSVTSARKTRPNPKDCIFLMLIPPIRSRRPSNGLLLLAEILDLLTAPPTLLYARMGDSYIAPNKACQAKNAGI